MDYAEASMEKHRQWRGKLEIAARAGVNTAEELSLAYTPGVAAPCLAIRDDPALSFELTRRWNTVAVITDGTAVLGLGDIGPEAAMPVMEGKCVLFKAFADIDAIPLCLRTKDTDELVRTISLLEGSFGGINLEDISAPRCFEVERRLKDICGIPVFHDDQHGTAVVVAAGLTNALPLVNKSAETARITICGAGAAGTAIARLLLSMGCGNIILVDKQGIITRDMTGLSGDLRELALLTNSGNLRGGLAEAVCGRDVFIGVSAGGILTAGMAASMAKDAVVFALANPAPEITPDLAVAAGAAVVATGRSDFPNQINNVLAFPGIFRGALDVRAREINEAMKLAAANALAAYVTPTRERILPPALDRGAARAVAAAVVKAAVTSGAARTGTKE